MQKSFRNEILLGIFFILVLALLYYMYQMVGGRSSEEHIEINAVFDSASGLVEDNYVMIAGVPVGYVNNIEVDFDKARISMKVKSSAKIRQDVEAKIRAKSLLGEKFVELLPKASESPLMLNGGTIQTTDVTMEVDEVFTSLRPFFEKLEPMAPKIENILGELETLLASLNETGKNKKETIDNIIDNTDKLLEQTNKLLQDNEKKISKTLTGLEKLVNLSNKKAPRILNKAEKTMTRLEAVAEAIPVETLQKVPEAYNKVDRILTELVPMVEKMGDSGDRIDKILKNLDILMSRLVKIDELAVRKFLQEEGVNVNLTQDKASKKRIKQLQEQEKK